MLKTKTKTAHLTPLVFLLIIGFSACFRLTNLDLIEFKADEAINLFLASRPLFGYPFPPGGTVSSIGLLNPPLFNYLLFPLILISFDPKIISGLIGLVNSLAIGFFFLILKRYFNLLTALITTLLFAFSPWAILFSRKIWPQNLLVPLTIFFFWSLLKIIKENRQNYWWLLTVFSLLIIQLHQAAIIFLFLLFVFLLLQRRFRPPLSQMFIGIFIGLLPLLPYLTYVWKNLGHQPEAIIVTKQRFGSVFHPTVFLRPLQILNQGNFHFVLGTDTLTFQNRFPLIYQLRKVFYLEYLLLPFGLFVFWLKERRFRFLTYAILGLPMIYFLLHFEPFIHYFLIVLPFLFLFLANGLIHLIQSKNRWFKFGSLSILISLIITSIVFNWAFFQLLKKQGGFQGDYGPIYLVSATEVEKKLLPYKNDPLYREMWLASFLPVQYWYGWLPVPKLVLSIWKPALKKSLLILEFNWRF